MERNEWLKRRKTGLGGTDVAAVLGLSNWRKPLDVYLDKTSDEIDFADSERMYWGRTLEETVAKEYTRRTGVSLTQGQFTRHPEFSWAVGTPDYLAQRWGVEVKTAANEIGWGPEGSASIPEAYKVQCSWYCFLTGMKRWDVAVLFGGQRFAVYHCFPDEDYIEKLRIGAEEFWNENVLAKKAPPAEPRDQAKELVSLQTTDNVVKADDEIEETVQRLFEVREKIAELKTEKENLEGVIKVAMQDSACLDSTRATVTWRKTKERKSVDWKAIAQKLFPLHAEHYLGSLILEHTIAKEGTRRFLLKEKKNG